MLASSPFLLAPGRPCPRAMRPRSMCVHAKARTRNQQISNGKKEMCRACEKGIKQTSMIDMASKETRTQVRRQTNKKAKKRWCPWGTNVGLEQMSMTSLCWSMDDTLASKTHAWTCKQACKDAKKPWVAQTSMVSMTSHGVEKGKGMHEAIGIMVMHPKWLHPNKALWLSGITTQPQTR